MADVFGYADLVQSAAAPAPWTPATGPLQTALRCTFSATNVFWVVGSEAAREAVLDLDPGADVLLARLMRVPSFSEDAGIISGSPGAGRGTYAIADIDFDLSNALQGRFANQQAVKGAIFTLFEANEGEPLDDTKRVRTSRGVTYSDSEGEILIEFENVYSLLRGKVFSKLTYPVARTVGVEDLFIPLDIDPRFIDEVRLPVFEHSDAYSTDPGERVGYLRTSTGEIVSYITDRLTQSDGQWGIVLYNRELYGTLAAPIEVDPDDARDAKPTLTEFVMFEERTVDIVAMVLEGATTDGRVPPAHWTRDLGPGYLDYASFAATAVGTEGRRFRHDDPPELDVREFLEKRVLLESFSVLVENNHGQFQLLSRGVAHKDAVETALFDETNLDIDYPIVVEHAVDQLRNPVIIKRGYDPVAGKFTGADIVFDNHTREMYGVALDPIAYEFFGWNSALGSSRALLAATTRLRDLHQDQTVHLSIRAAAHMGFVRLGDVVRVTLPPDLVRDASALGVTQSQPIDHTFTVIAREFDEGSGQFVFALYATLGRAAQQEATRLDHHLSEEGYAALAPTRLRDVVPSSMVGGVRVFGAGVHSVEPDRFYRIDEPASVPGDCQLVPSRRGHFIGIAHYEALTVGTTIAGGFINGRGMSVHEGTTDPEGSVGYIGRGTAAGGVDISITLDRTPGDSNGDKVNALSTPPTQKTRRPSVVSLQPWPLALDAGQLANLPRAIGGSGGGGSGLVRRRIRTQGEGGFPRYPLGWETTAGRAKGGDGGLSAVFLGPNLSRTPDGVYCDVSGGDPEISAGTLSGVHRGPGEPGHPGVAAFIVDGDWPNPDVSAGSVVAETGADGGLTPKRFTRIEEQQDNRNDFFPPRRSHFYCTRQRSHVTAHSAIMHVPPPRQIGSRTLSALDALADAEEGFDGKVTLHPMGESTPPPFPSNADVNDYAAFLAELTDKSRPVTSVRIWQLRRVSGQPTWVRVIFPDVIAEVRIAQFRESGATVMWVTPERPAVGEYAVGDTWYDRQSRRLYYLGETPDDDVALSEDNFSDYTGLNFLADPTFSEAVIGGKDTLRFDRTLAAPLLVEGQRKETTPGAPLPPGQTLDTYGVYPAVEYTYRTQADDVRKKAVEWREEGDVMATYALGGSGAGRVVYTSAEGIKPATDLRQVWVYVNGIGRLIVQGGGAESDEGTVENQSCSEINVQGSPFLWVRLGGHFPRFTDSLQLRTTSANLRVRSILLLAEGSTSQPLGFAGFSGGTASAARKVEGRPFWGVNPTHDQRYPLPVNGGKGPAEIGFFGQDGAPGVAIKFPGADRIIVMRERFPFKVTAGKNYLLTAIIKNELTSSFTNPGTQGVFVGLQCYDAQRREILTTYPAKVAPALWLSANMADFQELVATVEIPREANNVVWGSLILVVRGNAGGRTRIDSWNALESNLRRLSVRVGQRVYISRAQNGPKGTWYSNDVVFKNATVLGKRGMTVTAEIRADMRWTQNNGSGAGGFNQMGFAIELDYVDAGGRPVTHPLGTDPPRLRDAALLQARAFDVLASDTSLVGAAGKFRLATNPVLVICRREIIALHDFARIKIRYFARDDNFFPNGSRHPEIRGLNVDVLYGGHTLDGYQKNLSGAAPSTPPGSGSGGGSGTGDSGSGAGGGGAGSDGEPLPGGQRWRITEFQPLPGTGWTVRDGSDRGYMDFGDIRDNSEERIFNNRPFGEVKNAYEHRITFNRPNGSPTVVDPVGVDSRRIDVNFAQFDQILFRYHHWIDDFCGQPGKIHMINVGRGWVARSHPRSATAGFGTAGGGVNVMHPTKTNNGRVENGFRLLHSQDNQGTANPYGFNTNPSTPSPLRDRWLCCDVLVDKNRGTRFEVDGQVLVDWTGRSVVVGGAWEDCTAIWYRHRLMFGGTPSQIPVRRECTEFFGGFFVATRRA